MRNLTAFNKGKSYVDVYKFVFIQTEIITMSLNDLEKVQDWIKRTINDPLTKILLENSQFTQIQLETLLIDILAGRIADKKISCTEKSKMRLTEKKISRGAFNRTLQQARKNMTRSIWTVLLLGYLGVLETPSLSLFIETSNKLEDYMIEYNVVRNKLKNNLKDENTLKTMVIMQKNLKDAIYSLISPKKSF